MIVAGTGHRDLMGYSMDAFRDFMDESYPAGTITKVISGAAIGFDLMLAEWALEKQIPYALYMPFPFIIHTRYWRDEDKERLVKVIDNASHVKIFTSTYDSKYYLIRDKAMADDANEIISFYDGRKNGGTAWTVKYAKKLQKKVLNCFQSNIN